MASHPLEKYCYWRKGNKKTKKNRHWNKKALAAQMGVDSNDNGVDSNAEGVDSNAKGVDSNSKGVDSNADTHCDQGDTKTTEYYANSLELIVEDYETDDN